MQEDYQQLIKHLIAEGYLQSPDIISAFYRINRRDFVLPEYADDSAANAPLPIGYGQTISQPLTVAFMLELLQPKPGEKVLDIGSGSGWTVALLAEIVGASGRVVGIEIIPELCELARKNVAKYDFLATERATIICGDGYNGLQSQAPFAKIIVSAAAPEIVKNLKEQLAVGGRMVIPVGRQNTIQDIVLIIKDGQDKYAEKHYPGYVFVPLIKSKN